MKQCSVSGIKLFVLAVLVLSAFSLMLGCSGDAGSTGPAGPAGPSGPAAPTTGTISGTVTTSTGVALEGIQVSAFSNKTVSKVASDSAENYRQAMALQASATPVATATTDSSGNYSMNNVPPGSCTINFFDPNGHFTIGSINNVQVIAGSSIIANAGMGSATPVTESAGGQTSVAVASSDNEVGYGNTISLTASATSPISGATLTYTWSGATQGSTPTTATATMPTLAKAMGGTPAPSNDPGGYVAPQPMENRFGVLPTTADTRGTASPNVTVTDGMGGSVSVTVTLYATGVQPGVMDVAIGVPVYLNSGHDSGNSWSMTVPTGSSATLFNANTRNAWFKPDITGKYTLTEGSNSMAIYAGKWVGVIANGGYVTKTVTADEVGIWAGAAGTYTNWPFVTPDSGCTTCHLNNVVVNGLTAVDEFTPWAQTAHATFFSRGLEGITSNNGTCLTCHTVGYDLSPSAVNDGFDDMAKFENFIYAKTSTTNPNAWQNMLIKAPRTAKVSNIQCENCHGPQDTGPNGAHISGLSGGTSGAVGGTRVNYSAEVCATCHASGTGHHFYSEWVNSINPESSSANKGHSHLGQIDATGYSGHAQSTNVSCSRCHTAEGFTAYVDQLSAGNPAVLPSDAIVWTKNNAHVQTCTGCHDPHDDTNPNQLRLYDSIPMTMAGFGVSGMGKGAVCVACHNIRNGVQCNLPLTSVGTCPSGGVQSGAPFLHEDNDPVAATYMDTPHDNASADVFMGRNAFFVSGLPMLSKHAAVEDTCVGCHMTNQPATHLSHGATAVSSHQFYILDSDRKMSTILPGRLGPNGVAFCANCHSTSVDGEALVTTVENSLATLADKMAANLKSRVLGTTIYVGSSHTAVAVSDSTVVTLPEDSTNFSFTNGSTTVSGGLSTITTDSAGTTLVFSTNDILKKGLWNYILIYRDQSKGIHNPTFVNTVLSNTLAQF